MSGKPKERLSRKQVKDLRCQPLRDLAPPNGEDRRISAHFAMRIDGGGGRIAGAYRTDGCDCDHDDCAGGGWDVGGGGDCGDSTLARKKEEEGRKEERERSGGGGDGDEDGAEGAVMVGGVPPMPRLSTPRPPDSRPASPLVADLAIAVFFFLFAILSSSLGPSPHPPTPATANPTFPVATAPTKTPTAQPHSSNPTSLAIPSGSVHFPCFACLLQMSFVAS